MKIEGPSKISQTTKAAAPKKTDGTSSFASLVQTGEAEQVRATASSAAVGGIFMLQTESDEERGRRAKATKRADTALSLLEQITRALLDHSVSTAHLAQLKTQAQSSGEAVSDPKLAAILDEIDLRLAVETAKLEKAAESRL